MPDLYQEQCRRDDEKAKLVRTEMTAAEHRAERQAFWDAAAVGALAASSGSGNTGKTAVYAAEIADLLLVERMQRIDKEEI